VASATDRKLTRRRLFRGLVGGMSLAATGALAACAGAATPQVVKETVIVEKEVEKVVTPTVAPHTGPFTVTYYTWIDADRLNKFNDWVADFREANPDILVQLIPAIGANIENRQKLQAMILAGTPPDIAGYAPPDFYWSGMVISLEPLIARDSYDLSEIPQPLIDRASYNGELYNFPLQAGGNNAIMAYNKTMWEEAGVPFPPSKWNEPAWTWDEWVARLKTIMETLNPDLSDPAAIKVWGMPDMMWVMSHTRQWDIWWIDIENMKTITADTPMMLDCYTHVADLWCKHKVIPSAEVTEGWGPVDPFLGGMCAMRVVGSWMYTTYDKSEIDWEFAPFPKPENGNTNAELDPDAGAAIVKGSKNEDQAWEFIKWLDAGNFYKFWGSTPARPKYMEDWGKVTFQQHPDVNYMIMAEALANSREQDRLTLHPCWGEMYGKVINPKWQQVTLCNMSVEQFLSEAQVELQQISDSCQQKAF